MVIISGPGKCGGSLLMAILTELGLDTGYADRPVDTTITDDGYVDFGGNYEWCIRGKNVRLPFPYIVKEPSSCTDLDLRVEVFKESFDTEVDYVYVMLRRPGPIAPALAFLNKMHKHGKRKPSSFEKGLSGADLTTMESAFAKRILQVTHIVAELDIPHTFVSYPRFAADHEYAYKKFSYLMDKFGINLEQYKVAADKCIDKGFVQQAYDSMPEWVRATFRENFISKRRL